MKIPRPLQRLTESFQKLPGIGPKTAQRLTYYLLHVPQAELNDFAEALVRLKKDTVVCSICKNVSEADPCPICLNPNRDGSSILVVEQPLDVLVFERMNGYSGVYHVLHGKISPLDNIGPDEIFVSHLLKRISDKDSKVKEVIIATNPTMEGDATAMYLQKEIKKIKSDLTVSRLGMGIPTGADLEYADDLTLNQAFQGRRNM